MEGRRFSFTLDYIKHYLNLPLLESQEIQRRLSFLGYDLSFKEKEFIAIPPSWRYWNVLTRGSVIEDFARAYGLNQIPLNTSFKNHEEAPPNKNDLILEKMEKALLGNGFFEVITKSYYSLESVSFLAELDTSVSLRHIILKNALESSIMKITNIIHLTKLADYNLKRGIQSFKVYEFGRLFDYQLNRKEGYQYERDSLSMAVSGRWYDYEWRKPEKREELIFLFKGVLASICKSLGGKMTVVESKNPFLHPGCQSAIVLGGIECGFFGLIHPQLKDRLDFKEDLIYAEFDVASLLIPSKEIPQLVDYPSIRRDLTFKLKKEGHCGKVIDQILALKIRDLLKVSILDSFEKEDEDFRRVTYRLTFQSDSRTLESEEVDKSVEDLLLSVGKKYQLYI